MRPFLVNLVLDPEEVDCQIQHKRNEYMLRSYLEGHFSSLGVEECGQKPSNLSLHSLLVKILSLLYPEVDFLELSRVTRGCTDPMIDQEFRDVQSHQGEISNIFDECISSVREVIETFTKRK